MSVFQHRPGLPYGIGVPSDVSPLRLLDGDAIVRYMTASLVVDLYLRKSSKDGGRSVDRQRAELVDGAVEAGYTVSSRTFADPEFSASRHARRARPDYAALLEHIRSGQCQAIGLYESSRGSRSLTEWSMLLDLCRDRKVKIWVSTHERVYDLSRRRDWKALADEGVAAADEAELISERTRSGKRKAAREGRPAGRLVYGFTRQYDAAGKFVAQLPHPEQAPVVREIVSRVATGKESIAAIARDLNDREIPAAQGGRWLPTVIRATAMNPSYAGLRVHQGEVVGSAAWDPIVDANVWRRACAVLSAAGRYRPRTFELTYWLAGAMRCGRCRAWLASGQRSGGCGRVYRCRSCYKVIVSGPSVEALIEAAMLARLSRPDAAEAFRARPDDEAVHEAEQHLQELRDRLDEHYAESAAGRLSAAGLSKVEAMLQPQIDTAESKLRRLSLPPALADLADVDIAARWDRFDAATRRAIVRHLTEVVVAPATGRGRLFDPTRLDGSRWTGDKLTWGERRQHAGM